MDGFVSLGVMCAHRHHAGHMVLLNCSPTCRNGDVNTDSNSYTQSLAGMPLDTASSVDALDPLDWADEIDQSSLTTLFEAGGPKDYRRS